MTPESVNDWHALDRMIKTTNPSLEWALDTLKNLSKANQMSTIHIDIRPRDSIRLICQFLDSSQIIIPFVSLHEYFRDGSGNIRKGWRSRYPQVTPFDNGHVADHFDIHFKFNQMELKAGRTHVHCPSDIFELPAQILSFILNITSAN